MKLACNRCGAVDDNPNTCPVCGNDKFMALTAYLDKLEELVDFEIKDRELDKRKRV